MARVGNDIYVDETSPDSVEYAMPPYTCPNIDPMIEFLRNLESGGDFLRSTIEELRTSNKSLRDLCHMALKGWRTSALELAVKESSLREAMENIRNLEDELSEARHSLAEEGIL